MSLRRMSRKSARDLSTPLAALASLEMTAVVALLLLAPRALPAQAIAAEMMGAEVTFDRIERGDATLTEFLFPFGYTLRVGPTQLDFNTAYAQATLDQPDLPRSEIWGLTDLTLRLVIPAMQDRLRLIFAGNVPTGQATLTPEQGAVAAALATDLFTMPVANFGTGPGFSTALAYAQPLGGWVIGLAGTFRLGGAYEPFLSTAIGAVNEYRQAPEMRVRLALDRPSRGGVGVRLGASFSAFGDEEQNGEPTLRPGSRVLGEAMVEFPLGRGSAVIYGWDLLRMEGDLEADTLQAGAAGAVQVAASRNLAGGGVRLFLPLGRASLRPVAEALVQSTSDETCEAACKGVLGRVGAGVAFRVGKLIFEPAALGQFGTLDDESVSGFILRGGVAWVR